MNNPTSIFEEFAQGLGHTIPYLIICAGGLTFSLMCLRERAKARKLAILGCILGLIAPFFAEIVRWTSITPYYQYWYNTHQHLAILPRGLLMNSVFIGATICWFLAAVSDREQSKPVEQN